ncbi:subtilisin family serine protease [Streptomyces sp. B4I13]|uniref:S8/S53 family peptidase n=1 Tax=Streptomyces sp. B4I13 TaxID=3042271 RepID=UPI00277E832E|nr:S8/S53 family peptidase [Streptomyces sp. B4I13]MDQ0957409.1 subtilisin family serine protease [Streptomyces sp. B4I13]
MAPQRFHEQFDQIQRSLPDVPLAMGPDDSAEFIYEKGVVLARDGEEAQVVEDAVRTHFTATEGLTADHVRRAGPRANRSGITRIRVGDPGEGGRAADHAVAGALRALRETEGRAGRRLVSRNHVVSIAVNACPGDEPVPAPRTGPANPAAAGTAYDAPRAVGVLVVDTGLTHDYRSYPLLAHTEGDLQVRETDEDGVLQQYVGHGTFIAGLVAAVAPNTDVTVRGTLNDAGAILESEFGERLFDAVEDGWPDILSLSAGTSNGRVDGLLGVAAFMDELRSRHTLLVAAAGNNASAAPFWPAAYAALPEHADAVLSVGALRCDGAFGACFSNHGPWVTAYAPGERLVSAFTGFGTPVPYVYQHSTYDACRYGFSYSCTCRSPRHTGVLSEERQAAPGKPDQVMFEGLASWSGTSFATPLAAGLVAAHMTANQLTDPRAAARQLLAGNAEFAEVRGVHVPALLPPTWRPVPVGAA